MPVQLAHVVQDLRRQGRLVVRHLLYGPASFGLGPSTAKTKKLQHLFVGVNRWLRDLGVEYALAYGTLLGWYRDRSLIPHDRDIDFAAPVSAYGVLRAASDQLPRGFVLHDTSHHHRGPKLYVSHQGWEADIYFYAEDNGALCSLERSRNPQDMTPFPRDYYFPRQAVEFLGEPTFVPAQTEAMLRHLYGCLERGAVRDPRTRLFRPPT